MKTKTAVYLRVAPDEQSSRLLVLKPLTPLTVTSTHGDWLRVRAGSVGGFVHKDYVTAPARPETETEANVPAKTTTILNMRSGPSTGHAIVRVLDPNTPITVHARQGDWFRITANGSEGFVHSNFVQLPGEGADPGFIPTEERGEEPSLDDVPLPPADAEMIATHADMNSSERRVANTWNAYGGLFVVLANRLGINPGVAVAVFVAESGGDGFRNGRLLIRFENHVFSRHWGEAHPDTFNRHFRHQEARPWLSHQWRPDPNAEWRDSHGNQDAEWDAFSFARTLNDTAAKLSISMGAPQIMGFNYAAIGYESVHAMFDAFSTGMRQQIIGFFDFVKEPVTDTRRLVALQRRDFETFASLYNGPGQAALYSSIIQNLHDTFTRLRNQ